MSSLLTLSVICLNKKLFGIAGQVINFIIPLACLEDMINIMPSVDVPAAYVVHVEYIDEYTGMGMLLKCCVSCLHLMHQGAPAQGQTRVKFH